MTDEPTPPFLIIRDGQSFWVQDRPPHEASATLQAFRRGCFRDAWCYDATGGAWPILEGRLKQRPSLVQRVLPWTHVTVQLHLGARVTMDVAVVVSKLAAVLRSHNDFCESLRASPADMLAQVQHARTPADIIQIARSYA